MSSWAMRRLGGDSCSSGEADSSKDNQGPLRSFLSRYWRRMFALIGVERVAPGPFKDPGIPRRLLPWPMVRLMLMLKSHCIG